MPKFNKENAVLTKGVFLPDFLFFSDELNSKSIPPVASLNPATATDGEPFPSSTSPSFGKKKRTLIIDQNSFDFDIEYGEQIALLKRLQIAGFEIFLRSHPSPSNPSIFHKLDADLRNVNELRNLTVFNPKSDYSQLAKKGAVEPEKSLLLGEQRNSQSHAKEIVKALNQRFRTGRFLVSDWQVESPERSEFLKDLTLSPPTLHNPILKDVVVQDTGAEKDYSPEEIEEKEPQKVPFGFPSNRNNEDNFYEKVAFIFQQANERQQEWVIEAMAREIIENRRSSNIEEERNYYKKFINGAVTILKANPDKQEILLKSFDEIASEISAATLADSLYKGFKFESFEQFLSAVEIFPDKKEDLIRTFARNLRYQEIEEFSELIDQFPQEKSSLALALKTEQIDASSPQLHQAAIILNNIYSSADYDPFAEDFQKFERLTEEDLSKTLAYYEDKKAPLLRKYQALNAFILAAKDSGLQEIFETIFLENISRDFTPSKDHSSKGVSQEGATVLTKIIKKSSPKLAKKIIDFALDKKSPKEFILRESSFFEAAIKIYPQKGKELVHAYSAENQYSSIKMIENLASNLPAKVRKYFNSRAADPFITLEEALLLDHESSLVEETSNQTYLEIANVNKDTIDELEEKIHSGMFDNVAVVRILNTSNAGLEDGRSFLGKFVDSLLERKTSHETALRHFSCSENLLKDKDFLEILKSYEDQVSSEFITFQNYCGINELFAKAREVEINKRVRFNQAVGNSGSGAKAASRKIRIASGGGLEKSMTTTDSDGAKFSNITAGEVLNGDLEIQTRTCIIKRDIAQNLHQEEYVPSNFVKISGLKSLTDRDIEALKSANIANKSSCQFNQKITANKKFRLLSIHAAEKLLGIIGETEGLVIERGDDDFFYATSTTDRVLNYVLQAPSLEADMAAFRALPSDDKIKKIIDEYRDPEKGFASLSNPENKTPLYEPQNHQAWLDEVFEKRCGVCRHREAAVAYQLTKRGVSPENFRTVCINNNHVILEIKSSGGNWIKADFGGGEAVETDLGEEVIYGAGEVSEDKLPAKKEKTLAQLIEISDLERLVEEEKEGFVDSQEYKEAVTLERKKPLKKMAKIFLANFELPIVEDDETLKSKVVESSENNILVATKKTDQHANYFLEQATERGCEVFYIDHPSKIDLHRINLLIANDNNPSLRREGLLSDFLKNAAENSASSLTKRPLLLINWDAFSAKERVALNTLIDEKRSINGVAIDDSIQIIGLCKDKPKDSSFLSRHNLAIESKVNLAAKVLENSNPDRIIDLEGLTDWRRALFGKVILQREGMIWQKSEFVEALERGENNFTITNLSASAEKKLQYEVKQAKALGHFTYHGHKIPIQNQAELFEEKEDSLEQEEPLDSQKPSAEQSRNPRNLPAANLEISYTPDSFNFKKFTNPEQISLTVNTTFNQAPQDCHLINSYLFDALLCNKIIEDGTYQEADGLIAQCAKAEEKILKLFISSNLSESQWYCLFNEAQKHGIKLQLHTAPQVKLPEVATSEILLIDFEETEKSLSRIFVSNDANETLRKNRAEFGEDLFAVVDVEDFNYQDLIEKIDFKFDENGFRDFSKIESEFLTNLKDGKKIILKGEFSKDLLQMLQPILTSEAGKNLTLIIEDEFCAEGQVFKPLNWLDQADYQIETHLPKIAHTNFTTEDISEIHGIDENSKEKSDAFIEKRKSDFSVSLDSSAMLRLIGHSGVGKSSLLQEFETPEQAGSHKIYHGLDDLDSWASDKSGKRKILFLDESNINDCHFTIFSPLKKASEGKVPKQLFYKGKFYDFDDNHKVVFACNPVEYGGGRFEQKLFEDGEIPAIALRDFPANYIYEKILKEVIYDKLSPDVRENLFKSDYKELSEDQKLQISVSEFSEIKFKEFCADLIEKYQATNSKKKSKEDANEETVRELQENTLNFIEEKINSEKLPEIEGENFVSTNATKEVEEALNRSLNIRQNQRDGKFPASAVGLNGVLIEGDSGIGKSALITAVLQNKGITEKKFGEIDSGSKQRYYKIDANLPFAQKKEIIIRAFEEGNIVVLDELNSCVDDGLEKVLNAVLTGQHPDKKTDIEIKPGFMMISSVNALDLGGRSIISPAIRHRTTQIKAKSLKEYEISDFSKIITSWVNQENKKNPNFLDQDLIAETAQDIAKNFAICLQSKESENLNLRMLKSNLAEILLNYREVLVTKEEEIKGDLEGDLEEDLEEKSDEISQVKFDKTLDKKVEKTKIQTPSATTRAAFFKPFKSSKILPITSDQNPNQNLQSASKKGTSIFSKFRIFSNKDKDNNLVSTDGNDCIR